MAKLSYDVSDVESAGGGEEPQPGTYPGKIVSMVNRKSKQDGTKVSDLEIVVDIGPNYVRKWTYVKLPDDPNWNKDSHGWKLRELTDALGLPPKGSIDPAKITKEQPPVLVKIAADTNQGGDYRGKVKNLFAIGDHEVPETEASADGGGDEGPYGREEIETWTDDDLKGYAEELGVEIPTGRGAKAKLIDALVEAEEATGDGEDAGTADSSDGGSEAWADLPEDVSVELNNIAEHGSDYLSDWSDEDISWLIEGAGIDAPTSGRGWKSKAVSAIVEFANDGGATPGDEPEAEPDEYDSWSLDDLKAEIAARNEQGAEISVSGRVTKEKAIEALREDDKNAEPF